MSTMIKKHVAELEGAQLDWAVAMAGHVWIDAHKHFPTMTLDPTFAGVRIGEFGYLDGRSVCILIPSNPMRQDPHEFSPSRLWEHAGPIIEREEINVVAPDIEAVDHDRLWSADRHEDQRICYGPTPLMAAMRAFVASKLGDEVEVPA